jgi:hypothetical protein
MRMTSAVAVVAGQESLDDWDNVWTVSSFMYIFYRPAAKSKVHRMPRATFGCHPRIIRAVTSRTWIFDPGLKLSRSICLAYAQVHVYVHVHVCVINPFSTEPFTNTTFFHLLKHGCTHMQLPPGRSKRCTRIFNYESTRRPPSIWPQTE